MTTADWAANKLYKLIRDFAEQTKEWDDAIRYWTKPDERFDLTLVSYRVYGTGNEWQVIQAAAGLDSPEYELTERRLILPTTDKLRELRQTAGYEGYEVI